MKSLLVEYIKSHGDSWFEDFSVEHPDIIVKFDEEKRLAIFNYGIGSDFSDPLVQECRGIIIDLVYRKVACWPFRKFGKYNESYADDIDWFTARVQEKLDGSIMKLWYNGYLQKWQLSTNSVIDAHESQLPVEAGKNYVELFRSAENYGDINLDDLNPSLTYIFELCSPFNRVVVPYKETLIWHIGARNNLTGEEYDLDIGVRKPKIYDCKTLDECIHCVSEDMNKSRPDGKIDEVDHEGFVVVDANWHRIKVKSPIYLQLHGITTNSAVSKKSILGMLFEDMLDVQAICSDFPHLAHYIKYYDFRMTEFKLRAKAFIGVARKINEIAGGDRKAVALRIKDHKYQGLGFFALSHLEMTAEEIFQDMGIQKISKLIPDYDAENLAYMFDGLREDANA